MNRRNQIDKIILSTRKKLIDEGRIKNKSTFADILGSYTGDISKIEKGEKNFSIDLITRFLKKFGDLISPNELFGFENFENLENNISFLTEANAGSSIAVENNNSYEKFKLPDLHGEHFAFRVKGDSMFPTLENKDILVCKKVKEQHEIENDKVYVIISDAGVNVKRLKLTKKNTEISGITLISDNSQYHPSEIDLSYFDRLKLYLPVRRITQNGLK